MNQAGKMNPGGMVALINAEKNQIAYSFDYYFGEIQSHQNGTHEITMSFKLPNYNK